MSLRKNIVFTTGFEPVTSAPLARHYTNWAMKVHGGKLKKIRTFWEEVWKNRRLPPELSVRSIEHFLARSPPLSWFTRAFTRAFPRVLLSFVRSAIPRLCVFPWVPSGFPPTFPAHLPSIPRRVCSSVPPCVSRAFPVRFLVFLLRYAMRSPEGPPVGSHLRSLYIRSGIHQEFAGLLHSE